MSILMAVFQALLPRHPLPAELDLAYLNRAQDLGDLERRQREVAQRLPADTLGLVKGLNLS